MLIAAFFLALQSAAAEPAPASAASKPDIEINARVRARSVEGSREGEARIELRAEPEALREVRVERSQPAGQASYRDLALHLHAEVRIADPAQPSVDASLSVEPTGEPE